MKATIELLANCTTDKKPIKVFVSAKEWLWAVKMHANVRAFAYGQTYWVNRYNAHTNAIHLKNKPQK